MKKLQQTSLALVLASLIGPCWAGAGFDGIYHLGATETYWSVHQNGDVMIVGEFRKMPSNNITVTTPEGIAVRPTSLGVWELLQGKLVASTAELAGESAYGACSQTVRAVFNGAGTVTATITGMQNTPLGTTLGMNCALVFKQIESMGALSKTLRLEF